jgi:copper chaperone CopZ
MLVPGTINPIQSNNIPMKRIISIALLVLSMLACTPKQAPKEKVAPVMVEANLKVEGMHCDNCEISIAKGVTELTGIDSISANHEDSTAFVRYNASKTDLKKITEAIEKRGFHVASK